MCSKSNNSGFTLFEIVLVIGLFGVLFALGGLGYSAIQDQLRESAADVLVLDALSTASRRAVAGREQSDWGAYIPYDESTRRTDEIVIFAGADYASRDQSLDQTIRFPSKVKFQTVDFSGSGVDASDDHEIVFNALSGKTADYGSITLSVDEMERVITITPEGAVTRGF